MKRIRKNKKAMVILGLLCTIFIGGIILIPNQVLATIYQSDDTNIVGTVILPGDAINYGKYDSSEEVYKLVNDDTTSNKFIVAHSYLDSTPVGSAVLERYYVENNPVGVTFTDDGLGQNMYSYLKDYKDVFPADTASLPNNVFFYGWRIGDRYDNTYKYTNWRGEEKVVTRNGFHVYPIMVKYKSGSCDIQKEYTGGTIDYTSNSDWYTDQKRAVTITVNPAAGYHFINGITNGSGNKINIDTDNLSSNDEIHLSGYYSGNRMVAIDDLYKNAGTVLDKVTATTVTLNEWPGGQYGIQKEDGTWQWQDSPVFTGLEGETEYSFKTRVEEDSIVEGYTTPNTLEVTTKRAADPDNAAIEGINADGLYLDKNNISFHATEDTYLRTPETGDEKYVIKGYQMDDGTLTPLLNTSSVTYTNDLSTGKHKLSLVYKTVQYDGTGWQDIADRDYTVSKDLYIADTAPKAVVESRTTTSVTLKTETGYVYSKDNGKTYQDSPVFNQLESGKEYTFVLATKIEDIYVGMSESMIGKTNTIISKEQAKAASSIEGIVLNGKYNKNQEISFTAKYDTRADNHPVKGDVRYVPASWSVNPHGEWTKAPYSASFAITNAGNYTLKVIYAQQRYQDGKWMSDMADAYTVETSFVISSETVITTPDTENENNDKDPNTDAAPDDKTENNNSVNENQVETSDMTQIVMYGVLIMAALSVVVIVTVKKKRN